MSEDYRPFILAMGIVWVAFALGMVIWLVKSWKELAP